MAPTNKVAFTGARAFLSNYHPSPLIYDGERYPDVETAFAAAKTLDPAQRAQVRATSTPGAAKRIGRRVTLRPGWDDGVRVTVMAELLAAKFAPGTELEALLDATGDDELIESNTWGDRFWGQVDGTGTNMLGRLLVARRAINRARNGATIDARGDLWDLHAAGAWAVIPTNTQRRRDGTAVMGAGVAADAARRFHGLDARYGRSLAAGRHRTAYNDLRILCVPTKDHWRDPSTLHQVTAAAEGLRDWGAANPTDTLAVPALGAGLGGLDWDDVAALLTDTLAGTRAVLLAPR